MRHGAFKVKPDCRLRLYTIDRLLWVLLYRLWPRCLEAMVLVKPATLIQWHRQGFRSFWRWRSRSWRPSADREIRDLIRQMSGANPLWGAPRSLVPRGRKKFQPSVSAGVPYLSDYLSGVSVLILRLLLSIDLSKPQ
jgi:hypothetical protein